MADMPARKKPRELLNVVIERVDAVDRPATGKRFAVIKDENAALVEVVRAVVAEHLDREALLAELRAAVADAVKPVNRAITALGLSVADIRASDARRRRPPPGDDKHMYDGGGNVIQCYGEGCHDYDQQSGRWFPRRRGEARP